MLFRSGKALEGKKEGGPGPRVLLQSSLATWVLWRSSHERSLDRRGLLRPSVQAQPQTPVQHAHHLQVSSYSPVVVWWMQRQGTFRGALSVPFVCSRDSAQVHASCCLARTLLVLLAWSSPKGCGPVSSMLHRHSIHACTKPGVSEHKHVP